MYNFDFVIPSILILVIFLCYFFFKPKVPIYRYKIFLGILITQLLVIVFDIVSSHTDTIYEQVPIPLNFVLNMGFFVFYFARIFCFFLFTTVIIRVHMSVSKGTRFLMGLVFYISELIVLSSFFTHAVFYIDADGYHKGPLYFILYVCFFAYLFLSIVLLIFHRKRLTKGEFASALGYNVILIAGNIVRFLLPKYLVMNTFCMLAIMVIFLSFVNTDFYLSEAGGFNKRALQEFLDERLHKNNYHILGFALHNIIDLQEIYGIRQMTRGMEVIIRYLQKEYPQFIVFYLNVGRFVIVGPKTMDGFQLAKELGARFRLPWTADEAELYLDCDYFVMNSDQEFESGESIIESLLVMYAESNERKASSDRIIDVNDDTFHKEIVHLKRVLNRALEENGVEVFLQPLVNAKSGELVGAEALARLRDDDGSVISPHSFIQIAEKNGQINPLCDQILEKVCQFIQQNDMKKIGLNFINVNLSPIQCQNHDLPEHIEEIVKRCQVPAEYLHLEITEDAMIESGILLEQIEKMREKGFRIALDDYGSGYSNLSRIRTFPFSDIKIDLGIVQSHCKNPNNMLPTIVSLLKDQGFMITAEGIETGEMAGIMSELGCDFFQGYYYSRPIPMEEFLRKYS